jgi:hypothetical protein
VPYFGYARQDRRVRSGSRTYLCKSGCRYHGRSWRRSCFDGGLAR